jgi:hypothetical protein
MKERQDPELDWWTIMLLAVVLGLFTGTVIV